MHNKNNLFVIIVGVVIGALVTIILRPVPKPVIDRSNEARLQQKIDSVESEYRLFENNYKRLYRSLEVQQQEKDKLKKQYELLKRRKPRTYTDAEIDSILRARYGVPK